MAMNSPFKICVALLIFAGFALAQDSPGMKSPSVTIAAPPTITITRGKSASVPLQFRVGNGFHINSNSPKSEFLIATVLKIDASTDFLVGKLSYPAGEDMSFPFSPDEKLNVYTGDFKIDVRVRPLKSVQAGKYVFRGSLRYQACDNAACYPPKQLPVSFEVKVVKGAPTTVRKNPAQSPHAHR
jgi:hypothetical protein